MAGENRPRGRAVLVLLIAVVMVAAGCGDRTNAPTSGDSEAGISQPSSKPRPVIFPAGQLVWAQRSTIHVGDQTYDVSPHLVTKIDWTPYALYLELTDDPINGPFWNVEFDGVHQRDLPDIDSDIVTSVDGEYVAWIDGNGPVRPAGQVDELAVYDARTGDRIYRSSEGMGGEKGDDLGDRYEELPPGVTGIQDGEVYWTDADGSGGNVVTDLATGEQQRSERHPVGSFRATSGYEFSSPDGAYAVDATRTGKLKVRPRQPDFGHRWQVQGGWLGDHDLVVLAQDHFEWSYDPTKPSHNLGIIEVCNLDRGTCRALERVVGARDVVFSGVDVQP